MLIPPLLMTQHTLSFSSPTPTFYDKQQLFFASAGVFSPPTLSEELLSSSIRRSLICSPRSPVSRLTLRWRQCFPLKWVVGLIWKKKQNHRDMKHPQSTFHVPSQLFLFGKKLSWELWPLTLVRKSKPQTLCMVRMYWCAYIHVEKGQYWEFSATLVWFFFV